MAGLSLLLLLLPFLPTQDEATYRIQGLILDQHGHPIPEAKITLTPLGAIKKPAGTDSFATSGTRGRFSCGLPVTPVWSRLTIEKDGFATTVVDQIPAAPFVIEMGALRLLPPVSVTGSVVTEDGQPLAGASIASEIDRYQELSRTDGSFIFAGLPPAVTTLSVRLSGFADAEVRSLDLRDPMNRQKTITLSPSPVLTGTVTGPDGLPVAGAVVELASGDGATITRTWTSDDRGVVAVSGLPVDRTDVRLRVRGHGKRDQFVGAISSFSVSLAPAPLARVFVKEDHPPTIVSLRIEALTEHEDGWRQSVEEILPGQAVRDQGNWIITLPPGHQIHITATLSDGRAARSGPIEPDRQGELDVALTPEPANDLSGQVVDSEGNGMSVRVEALGTVAGTQGTQVLRATESDDNGEFSLDDVPLRARSLRAVTRSTWSQQSLERDTEGPFTLQPTPTASLTGVLHVNGDVPAVGWVVDAYLFVSDDRLGHFEAVSSCEVRGEGSFAMSPIPAGVIALVARPPQDPRSGSNTVESRRFNPPLDLRESPHRIRITEGKQHHTALDVEMKANIWLTGTLTINGIPHEGVRILTSGSPQSGLRSWSQTNAEGRFGGLASSWTPKDRFVIHRGSLRTEIKIDLPPNSPEQDVSIEVPAGTVTGRVHFEQGEKSGLHVTLERLRGQGQIAGSGLPPARVLTDTEGAFAFPLVARGVYRILVTDPTGVHARTASSSFEVRGAESIEIPRLTLPRSATLNVELTLPLDTRPPFASLEIQATPDAPPLPSPFVAWFDGTRATVPGLPPGSYSVAVHPYGSWQLPEPVLVNLSGEEAKTIHVRLLPKD